jgi:hypothetical protein
MSRRSHYRGQRGPRPGRIDAPGGSERQQPADGPVVTPREADRHVIAPAAAEAEIAPAVTAVLDLPGTVLAPPAVTSVTPPPPASSNNCTAPQLRRFIKSRAWVPMHELRRRFGINGTEDDVTPVAVDGTKIYVGLPPREGQLLGELLRAGDIGYELSLDPSSPIVIGVYPMRPVPRH